MTRLSWWRAIEAALARGERVFACFVVAATKGSPGTPGAALALAQSGAPVGTIGGGGMERALLQRASELLETGMAAPRWETLLHHRGGAVAEGARESGLICGGSQTHVEMVLETLEDAALVRAVLASLQAEDGRVLIIDGAGLRLEASAAGPRQATFITGNTETEWSYRLPLHSTRRVAILGGGHCGLALARVLEPLDFVVTVFDRRANLYTFLQIPEARRCAVESLAEAGAQITFPESTLAVVMTSDYPSDVESLRGLLPHPFPFIGVMGAKPKIVKIREALAGFGFDPETIARITAPVGLPIESDTPEEIAISVAAQILLEAKKTPIC